MARRKSEKTIDPLERARLKKLRSAERRAERKRRREKGEQGGDSPSRPAPGVKARKGADPNDRTWLFRSSALAYANKVINLHKERPYWLSIPHGRGDGAIPGVDFFPCTMFRTEDRTYYGFLFRIHRELMVDRMKDARRELTGNIPPQFLG
jgi:hypothetical protein